MCKVPLIGNSGSVKSPSTLSPFFKKIYGVVTPSKTPNKNKKPPPKCATIKVWLKNNEKNAFKIHRFRKTKNKIKKNDP